MHLITSSALKECLLVHNAPINVKPVGGRQGMGWGFDCLFWPWVRAFDRSCSPGGGDIWIFLRPTWERCGIFDCRLGRKRLRLNIWFPTSTLHTPNGTVRKDLEIMEANENKTKVSGFRCIDQLNLLRYCGIKVNRSKEKPSRFLQVQLISVWLIRYNHWKLIKMTFFVPFTKNGIFKLTKCGLSPKGLCILRSVTRIMVKTYNCSCNRNMYLWWCSNVYK